MLTSLGLINQILIKISKIIIIYIRTNKIFVLSYTYFQQYLSQVKICRENNKSHLFSSLTVKSRVENVYNCHANNFVKNKYLKYPVSCSLFCSKSLSLSFVALSSLLLPLSLPLILLLLLLLLVLLLE